MTSALPDAPRPGRRDPMRYWRPLRQLAVGAVALGAFLAVGGSGWYYVNHPTATGPLPCVSGSPSASPQTVSANVYNGTGRTGLARRTASQLERRGLPIAVVGNTPRITRGPARVTYDPAYAAVAEKYALVVGVKPVPNPKLSAEVDIVLGTSFRSLRTPAQVRAAEKRLPRTPSPTPSASASPTCS